MNIRETVYTEIDISNPYAMMSGNTKFVIKVNRPRDQVIALIDCIRLSCKAYNQSWWCGLTGSNKSTSEVISNFPSEVLALQNLGISKGEAERILLDILRSDLKYQ